MAEIGIAVEVAVKKLVDSASIQLAYVWSYKRNFKNLERQRRMLCARKVEIKHLVEEAKNNGEEIHRHVLDWLHSADKMIEEVTNMVEDNKNAEMKCFKCLCPNLKLWYKLSKNAEIKAKDVFGFRDEGNFDRISYRGIPKETWHPSSKLYEDFESRMSTLNDVINALDRDGVSVVGIYGMGGIGKTTLVREVGRKVEENKLFDSVLFVEVSEHPYVEKIQGAISDKLGFRLQEETSSGRARALCERLKKETKVLLILDNIWESLDLGNVGIPLNDDHKGCKLLLTARKIDVLWKMDCQTSFPIGVLDEKETWNLFEKIVGSSLREQDLQSLAVDVAKRCGGLPIAIVTIGKALKNEPIFVWKNALQELRHPSSECRDASVTQETYSCIRLSYSQLKSDELKEMFLLCCMMFLVPNTSIENLLRYGLGLNLFYSLKTMEEARDQVNTLIQKLKETSLLLETSNKNVFSIHDVVRDVGQVIASENQQRLVVHDIRSLMQMRNLKNCTAIFLVDISELPMEFDCPYLTLFYLRAKTMFSVPDGFFNKFPALEVLHLIGMDFSESPTSLISLKKLRALMLECSNLGDISFIGDITNLNILVILYCQYNEKMILPVEIGRLNRLRWLDLRGSSFIVPPKIISKLIELEELYMGKWYDQREVQELGIEVSNVATLDELKNLCYLTTLHMDVAEAEVLPKNKVFQRLKRYNLRIGSVQFMSHFSPNMRVCSRTLVVGSDTRICVEDGVVRQLKGIEDLTLQGNQRIKNVISELDEEGFLNLKYLCIVDNHCIRYIIDPMSAPIYHALPVLKLLYLKNLASLEMICHSGVKTKCFCHLTCIQVERCDKLKNLLPLSIAKHLSLLEEMKVENCENIEEIFNVDGASDRVSLEQLRSLNLIQLPRLTSICSESEVASAAQEIRMPWTSNASSSEIVSEDQWDVLPLFTEKVVFPNLKHLNLEGINLKSLWPNQFPPPSCWVKSLTRMNIHNCSKLKYLFSSSTLGSFEHLQHLKIYGCNALEKLIRIDDRSSNYVEFMSLESLEISSCPELKEFIFSDEVSYPNLQEIKVESMANLRRMWQSKPIQSVEHGARLCKVEIHKCESLDNIFPASIAKTLLKLEKLDVRDCGVSEIVAKEGRVEGAAIGFSFPRLTSLRLQWLQKLTRFYSGDHITEWPKLKVLEVKNCIEIVDLVSFQKPNAEGQLSNVHMVEQPLFFVDQPFFHLESLKLDEVHIIKICQDSSLETEYLFPKLECLQLTSDRSTNFPHSIFEKFHFLRMLELEHTWYREIFSSHEEERYIGKSASLKGLRLSFLSKLKQIWNSKCKMDLQKLEILEVSDCHSLRNLMPESEPFKNLKILKIIDCGRLKSLLQISVTKGLLMLEEIKIECCGEMTEIIGDECGAMEEKITLSKLKSLQLLGLENLISFCSGNSNFNFPMFEELRVYDCPKLKFFSLGVTSTPNLQEVEVERTNCKFEDYNLNSVFQQIHAEKALIILKQSVLSGHELCNFFSKDNIQVFPKAQQLNLNGDEIEMWQNTLLEHIYPKLKCLHIEDDKSMTFSFKRFFKRLHHLEKLELQRCAYKELFSCEEMDQYAQVKCLDLCYLEDVEQIWSKDSVVQSVHHNLESLVVHHCYCLTYLLLPSSSFESLKIIRVSRCKKLNSLMVSSTAKSLVQLEEMKIDSCKMMRQVVADLEDGEEDKRIIFQKLKKLEIYNLSSLTSFCSRDHHSLEFPMLEILDVKRCSNMETFAFVNLSTPMLQDVLQDRTHYVCKGDLNKIIQQHNEDTILTKGELGFKNIWRRLQNIAADQQVFSNLEKLSFMRDEISWLWQSQFPQQLFPILKRVEVIEHESKSAFPLAVLDIFHSVEKLELRNCPYEEIFSCHDIENYVEAFSRIKELSLNGLDDLKQMWKQDARLDPILQVNIESLVVQSCGSLVMLMPPSSSFQNLEYLNVEGCNGLMNLFNPTTAESLVQLTGLYIGKCKMMKEVISSEDEAGRDREIIFKNLKHMEIYDLSNLTSFCPYVNYTFTFPLLDDLDLTKCPKMKFFSAGVLNTPWLDEVWLDGKVLFCDDDLNATIQEIHQNLNAEISQEWAGSSTHPSSTI